MNSKKYTGGLILIAILGLSLWGGMLLLTSEEKYANELLIHLGKTGVTLSLISVVGGLVQWILKNRELEKQKEEELLQFYKNLLSDFKAVYDKVERARLLIQANQTAKTYGEQMKELISCVVILHNIKRALNPEFPILQVELKESINKMNHFFKELLKEYRENYKRIAVFQLKDETQKNEIIKKEIQKNQREDTDYSKGLLNEIPKSAWEEIEKLEKLKPMTDDSEDIFKIYEEKFLTHYDNVSEILRQRIPVKEKRQ